MAWAISLGMGNCSRSACTWASSSAMRFCGNTRRGAGGFQSRLRRFRGCGKDHPLAGTGFGWQPFPGFDSGCPPIAPVIVAVISCLCALSAPQLCINLPGFVAAVALAPPYRCWRQPVGVTLSASLRRAVSVVFDGVVDHFRGNLLNFHLLLDCPVPGRC